MNRSITNSELYEQCREQADDLIDRDDESGLERVIRPSEAVDALISLALEDDPEPRACVRQLAITGLMHEYREAAAEAKR